MKIHKKKSLELGFSHTRETQKKIFKKFFLLFRGMMARETLPVPSLSLWCDSGVSFGSSWKNSNLTNFWFSKNAKIWKVTHQGKISFFNLKTNSSENILSFVISRRVRIANNINNHTHTHTLDRFCDIPSFHRCPSNGLCPFFNKHGKKHRRSKKIESISFLSLGENWNWKFFCSNWLSVVTRDFMSINSIKMLIVLATHLSFELTLDVSIQRQARLFLLILKRL